MLHLLLQNGTPKQAHKLNYESVQFVSFPLFCSCPFLVTTLSDERHWTTAIWNLPRQAWCQRPFTGVELLTSWILLDYMVFADPATMFLSSDLESMGQNWYWKNWSSHRTSIYCYMLSFLILGAQQLEAAVWNVFISHCCILKCNDGTNMPLVGMVIAADLKKRKNCYNIV